MPRPLRGRFEPVDHFVLGHLSILGPLPALGSPHAAKRFIGLAIVVRGKDRVALASSRFWAQLYLFPRVAAYPPAGFHRAVPFTPRLRCPKNCTHCYRRSDA